MKKKFSTSWKSSRKPRKQRKYQANAPIHIKRKMLGANLSKNLRKKTGKRSIQIKKGDTVKVMRGKFKGKTGKIVKVLLKNSWAEIEGIQVKKQDGSKINIKFRPSNLQITELNLEDKRRNKSLKKEVKKDKQKKKSEKKGKKSSGKKKSKNKKSKSGSKK